MRIITYLLVIALIQVCHTGYSQITLKERNAPFEKVLSAIEKQTKYVFLYGPDDLKIGPITIDVQHASLEETLEKCFKGMPVEWSVVGNNVLLKKKLVSRTVRNASIKISGSVTDEKGNPIQHVTVMNKREGKATETDSNGTFSLTALRNDVLRFSYVGYEQKEIIVAGQYVINIALVVNPASPEQVVVIGYGSSKKKDLTGAVAVVDTKGFNDIQFNTVDNALAGRATGVEVTRTDGTPGGMVRVRIRGSSSLLGGNDPLYVIDGIPMQVRNNFITPGYQVPTPLGFLTNVSPSLTYGVRVALPASFVNSLNSLNGLAPENIESITILKDASSAAIYGAKAANGVVVITTTTGKANTSPRMELSYSSTVSTPYKTPRLLNASQYRTLITEAAHNAYMDDTIGGPPYSHLDLTDSVLNSPNWLGTANTNWIKQVTRTTLSNHVGLSISGGGPASKYYSSIAYNSTPGVVQGTDYQRISGKLNVESYIGPRFRIAANLLAGFISQDIGNGAYSQALFARPDLSPLDAAGHFNNFNHWKAGATAEDGVLNPAALLTAINTARTVSLLGTLSAGYAISKDLSFRSALSLNMQHYNQRNYSPPDVEVLVAPRLPAYTRGVNSEANSRSYNWFVENTLGYHKQFSPKHGLNVVAGQSFESLKYSWFTATGGGFQNSNFTNLSSADTMLHIGGDEPRSPQTYLLSFYVRTNYSYADKYLLTFTGRIDGSSKFGSAKLYSYFPSGALAWRISRESFLSSIRWLTDLKIRGSYGQTGNQNIGDQTKYTLYSPVTYAGGNALIPTVLGNEIVKPEITKSADIGLDVSLFDDRLYATADYYRRHTSNAVLSLPVTPSSTYSVLTQHAAGIRNKGFEVLLGGDIVRGRDLKWSASVNVTWNRTLVTELNSTADLAQIVSPAGLETTGRDMGVNGVSTWGNTALIKGQPLGLITGSYITGLIRSQAEADAYRQQLGGFAGGPLHMGDAMFQLDSSTAAYGFQLPRHNVILGKGAPEYFGGMTQEVRYKRFELQCFFSFSNGGHLLWIGSVTSHSFYSMGNAVASMQGRYTPTHTNTNAPRLNLNVPLAIPTNLDVFSSSYFKLRSLILSYNLDQLAWMKKTGMKGLRVFLSATNVFTITKYPGSDPETSNDAYSVNGGYIDAGIYPAVRTFSFGLKATFQ